MRKVGPQVPSSSSHSPTSFPVLGVNQRWICWLPHIPIQVIFIILFSSHYLQELWGWIHSAIHGNSDEVCISPSSVNSSSVVHISSGTCHKSIQTSYSSGTMLDGGFLSSHSSQQVDRHSLSVSHCKGSHQGCFGRLVAQGSANAAFIPLTTQRCVCVGKGSLPESVRWWQG